MIRLAARLMVSGGRESLARLVLTALGVAVGATLLLIAAAADPAIRAQQRHTAWQDTLSVRPPGRDVPDDPLLWLLDRGAVDGQALTVLYVAATGPSSPIPLGLERVPLPGEVRVSPALADMLADLPADRLADRFPSEPIGTIEDRYLAGPDDLVAVIGMRESDLRRAPSLEVFEIRTDPPDYAFSDFLRLAMAIGAVGLVVPVLVFVGTSTRIGAARREQRFAAMRLAGATPKQITIVASVEAGAAAAAGTALGAVGYLLARPHAAKVEIDGHSSFLHDVRVAPALLGLILLIIPAMAVIASATSLRRLRVTPLGVSRRAVRARPTARRMVPFVLGTVGFAFSVSAATGNRAGIETLIPVIVTFALMIYGIVVAGPWLTVVVARVIGRTGRRASTLLAGRRLEDDPAGGFRTVSGVVIAVFIASVFSGVTPAILAERQDVSRGLVSPTTLVAQLPVGPTQGDTALAAAEAAGGTDGVLLRVDPDPERELENPAIGRARTLLIACADATTLGLDGQCPAGRTAWVDLGVEGDLPMFEAPYTEQEAALMPAELLVVETDGHPDTTDRIRTAIIHAVPTASPWLGSESDAESNRQLVQLNRLVNLALIVTLAIAGCGLAVAVAAGILERKRPFALLRLAGMHLRELQLTALLEAAAPLLLIATATAILGLGTSALIVAMAGEIAWAPPSMGYWICLVAGIGAAISLTAAALPLLGRSTAPSAVRFE